MKIKIQLCSPLGGESKCCSCSFCFIKVKKSKWKIVLYDGGGVTFLSGRQCSHFCLKNSVDQNSEGKRQFSFSSCVLFAALTQFHHFLPFVWPFEIPFHCIAFQPFTLYFVFYLAFFLSRFSPLFRFNLNYFYLLLDFRLKRYSMTKWNSNHINYVTKCADYTPIEYKMNVLCSSEWTTEH